MAAKETMTVVLQKLFADPVGNFDAIDVLLESQQAKLNGIAATIVKEQEFLMHLRLALQGNRIACMQAAVDGKEQEEK